MANKSNVINIQLEESYQDFVIGGEEFRVGLGEDNRSKWIKAKDEYEKKASELDKYTEEEIEEMSAEEFFKAEESTKEALVYACDAFLGDGAFERLYSICKDKNKIAAVFFQVANELVGAMDNEQDELMKKFNSKMTKAKAK